LVGRRPFQNEVYETLTDGGRLRPLRSVETAQLMLWGFGVN
jgi:hypothetical protein